MPFAGGGGSNRKVKRGWLAPPLPIDLEGSAATYTRGSVNIAFRYCSDQANKLCACDDLKYNEADLFFTIWAFIKLPTWGHIAQMCPNVRHTKKEWEFYKSDHEAEYKQLPMRPEHANLAMAPHRGQSFYLHLDGIPSEGAFGRRDLRSSAL